MKTLKLEDEVAKKLYKTASAEFKILLEENFGEEFFSQKITDRIKTWDDVLNELGISNCDVIIYQHPSTNTRRFINACAKIQKISEVLNEGWVPDFNNKNEQKWYPYFQKTSEGWVVFSDADFSYCVARLGSGFYFKSQELALYAGNQFFDTYKEYLPN